VSLNKFTLSGRANGRTGSFRGWRLTEEKDYYYGQFMLDITRVQRVTEGTGDVNVQASYGTSIQIRTTRTIPPPRPYRRNDTRTRREHVPEVNNSADNITGHKDDEVIRDAVWREIARQEERELRAAHNWVRLYNTQDRIRERKLKAILFLKYQNQQNGKLKWEKTGWISRVGNILFRNCWCAVRHPFKIYETVATVKDFSECLYTILIFLWYHKAHFFTAAAGAAANDFCYRYNGEQDSIEQDKIENFPEAPSEAPSTLLLQ
jgi:hypothetical protein